MPARRIAGVLFGGTEHGDQLCDRCPDEIHAFDPGCIGADEPPDAPVFGVAAGVTEVDFAVVDDWVVPVGDVERPIGPHLEVDRPECAMPARDDVRLLFRDVARVLRLKREPVGPVAAEIVGDEGVLPVVGETAATDHDEPAVFRSTGVEAGQDPAVTVRGRECRSAEGVVDAVATRAIGGEGLAPAVESVSPRVDQSA